MPHRQLPGRMADNHDERSATGSRGADYDRRLAALLLGGPPWQKSNALSWRSARRYLAHVACRRSWTWRLRRRLPGQQFREFEPVKHVWKKSYNVYSKIDTEAPRFLEFEKWWGSPVLLNAEEMQSIADELFVGNKLTSGEIFTSDGVRIDIRNIKSPIIVFCSWGDDITPPQPALDWILDLYESEDEIVEAGQTIIYALHQSIGHLGIFVSAKVATKEHEEFAKAMDLIDVLPPGLYEAEFVEKTSDLPHAELVSGKYLVRFEARTLNDIRALGGNDAEDDLRFATVARVSEINQGLYRTFVSPLVQAGATEQSAQWLRQMHPHRLRYELFSDRNPFMRPVAELAEQIRANRISVAEDNPFLAAQEAVSNQVVEALDCYRDLRNQMVEAFFMNFYGAKPLQAMVGLCSDMATARPRVGRDVARDAAKAKSIVSLDAGIERGGLVEASVRALLYLALGHPQPGADERSFEVLRRIRADLSLTRELSLAQFKEVVRRQYLLLRRDEERAVAAIPRLLPADAAERAKVLNIIRRIAESQGDQPEQVKWRLARIETLFAVDASSVASSKRERLAAPAVALTAQQG